MTATAQLGRCSLPLAVLTILSSHISALSFKKEKKQRSRLVNACFYHTYSSVKLAQPMSITSTPSVMLSMETVALLESNSKHLVNTRRNQTYRPSPLLTKAVLESIQQAVQRKTALQAVWCLGYSAEYRQVGCCQGICASLPE